MRRFIDVEKRQPNKALGIISLGFTRRVEVGIGYKVSGGVHPSGRDQINARDIEGCRPVSKELAIPSFKCAGM